MYMKEYFPGTWSEFAGNAESIELTKGNAFMKSMLARLYVSKPYNPNAPHDFVIPRPE